MNCGAEVRIPIAMRASELHGLLTSSLKSCESEVYIRDEDGRPVLYLVKHDGNGRGYILCSRPLTYLPEEA